MKKIFLELLVWNWNALNPTTVKIIFYLEECWGVSSTDGLALMWHIPTKLSSAQSWSSLSEPSPRTVIFMMVLSWGGISPSYRLCMYSFLSIYFLSHISESCYHLNLPLTITKSYCLNCCIWFKMIITILPLASFSRQRFSWDFFPPREFFAGV